MSGFSALYEEVDRVMAEAWEGVGATPRPPMWVLLLHIADPASMREYTAGDLEKARKTLAWAQWEWNLFRMSTAERLREVERRQPELEEFVGSILVVLKMTINAQAWPGDLRVVTQAAIAVGPNGEWQLEVTTA